MITDDIYIYGPQVRLGLKDIAKQKAKGDEAVNRTVNKHSESTQRINSE